MRRCLPPGVSVHPMFRRTVSAVLLSLAFSFTISSAAEARKADYVRGVCKSGVQKSTKLKGVNCKQAKRVVNRYFGSDVPFRPICRGQGSVTFRGWKVTGVGTKVIATRFNAGAKSFLLSGGGKCQPRSSA